MFPFLEMIQQAQATFWTISVLTLVALGFLFVAIRLTFPSQPGPKEQHDQYAD